MALLDLLQSPQGLLGLNVLQNPTQPASGLLQGLRQNQAFQGSEQDLALGKLRQQLAKQKIFEAQQQSGRTDQQRQIAEGLTGSSPLQNSLLQMAGLSNDPLTGITGVLNATQGESPESPFGKINPKDFTQESIAKFLQTIDFADLVAVPGSPLVKNVIGGELPFKVPPGYMLTDPNDPLKGVSPIPGGPVTRKTPEQAAKVSLLSTAKTILPDIKNALIVKDPKTGKTSIDRSLVATMNTNAPFTEGRLARTRMLDAVEAKLRAESGAAVPQSEVKRSATRFMPNVLDSDESIIDKMDRLEEFLDTALKSSDPELFKRLTEGKVSPEGKVEARKNLNGKQFIKQNGQWFEVQ